MKGEDEQSRANARLRPQECGRGRQECLRHEEVA